MNVEKLHKIHSIFPNVPRCEGKTFYCFDSLLRCAQTGAYKKLGFFTNNAKIAEFQRREFLKFVQIYAIEDLNRVVHPNFTIIVNNCEIGFYSMESFFKNSRLCDGIIVDKI